tara:strand:+ start:398 stop:622 length:225 start_codon:yes stop_codon:yes gene_type:complete
MKFIFVILLFSCNNSQITDCTGIKGGDAVIDECGVCTGGTTGLNYNYLMNKSGHCSGHGVSNKSLNEIVDYLLL